MSNLGKFLTYSALILLLVLLVPNMRSCKKKADESEPKEIIRTERIIVRDTIVIREPIVKEVRIVDTIMIPTDTTFVQIVFTQNMYEGDGYKAWVSGYMPRLDSINIFKEKEYIKETIEREIVRDIWNYYVGVGAMYNNGNVGVKAIFTISAPKYMYFGGEIGYMNKKPFYGINIGFKIR